MPCGQFLVGTGSLIATSLDLLDFGRMTPKKISAAASPIAATPNPISDTLTTPVCLPCIQGAAQCQCPQCRQLEIPFPAPGLTQHPGGLFASTWSPSSFGTASACRESSLAPWNLQTALTIVPSESLICTSPGCSVLLPARAGIYAVSFVEFFFSSFDALNMCRSFFHRDATNSRVVFLQQRLESQAEFFPSLFELLRGKEKRWLLGFIVDLEAQCLL